MSAALFSAPIALASTASAAVIPRLDAPAAPAVKDGREAPELATARSRTWVRADGAHVTRVYPQDVNAKDSRGKWSLIDRSLKKRAGGYVSGTDNAKLELPERLDGPVTFRDGDRTLSMRLLGGRSANAVVDGKTARYEDVAPGVSAIWTAGANGGKEDLVLANADAQSRFVYELDASDGLSPKVRRDGGVDVVAADGDVAFALAAPFAVDAKGVATSNEDAEFELERDGKTWKLAVAVDREWLTAEGRAFPVKLDPSATMDASSDCYLDAGTVSTSYCSSNELWVGTSGGHERRAALNFDVRGTVPAGAYVQAATLRMYSMYQTSPGTSKSIVVRRATNEWDGAATWNSRKASTAWTSAGGDMTSANLDSKPITPAGSWESFTITDTVSQWLDGTQANQGVFLTDNGSTANNSVVYASVDHPNDVNRPWLEIEYYPSTGDLPEFTLDKHELTSRSDLNVNVAGGNLLLKSQDLQVNSPGIPLSFERFYNSQDPWGGTLGSKGRFSLGNDIALYECDGLGNRCLVGPSGHRIRFIKNPDGSYTTPYGVGNSTLRQLPSGRFELTDNKTGIVYGFFNNAFSYADEVRDQNGNHLTFQYAGTGNTLSKIWDTAGRGYDVSSDSNGRITSISVPTSVLPGGATWSYGYTGKLLTSVTDPESNTTSYSYSTDGHELLTKIVDGRGNETLIGYDTSDRVTSVTRKVDGTPANDVTTTYAYASATAPCGGLAITKTTVTDPRGKTTTYCSNQQGNVIAAYDALGREVANQYNAQGNATKLGDFAASNGTLGQTSVTYAGTGSEQNVASVTEPGGEQLTASYPSSTNPLVAARPSQMTDGNGKTQYYTYDSNGNVTQIADDPTTPVVKSVLTRRSDGQLATSTDGKGATTSYGYDSQGNLTSVTQPGPITTTYTYDGLGRRLTETDGRGKVITYGYNRLGENISISDSDGSSTSLAIDANGNTTGRVTGTQTTTYVYDKLNRKTSETFPGGASNTYTYDKAGNLTSIVDAGGTTSYGYDDVDRVTSVTSPTATTGTDTTTIAYADATTSTPWTTVTKTLPGNGKIVHTYDLSQKLEEVFARNAAGATMMKRVYNYASGGTEREQVQSMEAYTTGGSPLTTTTYSYGSVGQLLRAKTISGTAGGNVRDDVFTYDAAGNRLSRVRTDNASPAATQTYAYNVANQLCWRANSAIASPSCGTVPSGATTFSYDAAGNQLTNTATTWDAQGRLKTLAGAAATILSPDSNDEITAHGTATYHYNDLGVSRINALGALSQITRDPVSGAAFSQVAAGAKRWFVTDNIGTTIGLANDQGTTTRAYNYDTDGTDTTSGTGPETWIRFAGGQLMGSTGLYHFGERYYQPNVGRWTQQDPLAQPMDLREANRYSYVGNDFVNEVDPSGLKINYYKSLGRKIKDAFKVVKKWFPPVTCGAGILNLVWQGLGSTLMKKAANVSLAVASCMGPGGKVIKYLVRR